MNDVKYLILFALLLVASPAAAEIVQNPFPTEPGSDCHDPEADKTGPYGTTAAGRVAGNRSSGSGVFNTANLAVATGALQQIAPVGEVMQPSSLNPLMGPQVSDNKALLTSCTGSSGCPSSDKTYPTGVWRDTLGNGNGAPPWFYEASNLPCSLNAGAGDDGYEVRSADGKCWIANASYIDVREYPVLGDGVESTGITTKAGSTTIGGVTFAASQIGESIKIIGVGRNGTPLITTITGNNSLAVAPSISSSSASPSYFGNNFLIANSGLGYQVGDVLSAPPPISGSAKATMEVTVDAVTGKVPTALRISQPGAYTSLTPWGSGARIALSAGHGSGIEITPTMLKAGIYFSGADDSAAINAAISAAINLGISRVYFPAAKSFYGICANPVTYSASGANQPLLVGDRAWVKVLPSCAAAPPEALNFIHNFPVNYGQAYQAASPLEGFVIDGSHLTKYAARLSGNSFAIYNSVFENPAPATAIPGSAIVYGSGNVELELGTSNWLIAANGPGDVYYTGPASLPAYGLYESGGNSNFTGLIAVNTLVGMYSLDGDNVFGPGTHAYGALDWSIPSNTTYNPSLRMMIGLEYDR